MSGERTAAILGRAREVVPHGVFGHHRSFAFAGAVQAAIPADYPHFVTGASGCRFRDPDGRELVDYLCGYGPMIVGYDHPRIRRAVEEQLARGVCHTFPTELYAQLARVLVDGHQGAAWAALALNGTDAVHLGLLVARAHTGRDLVAVARGAYHGNQPWAAFGAGRIEADRSATRWFGWDDLTELEAVLADGEVAAVVLCPYQQLVGAENRMPAPGHWSEVRRACDAVGSLLLIDDVRSGFRLHRRGSCACFGIDADLVALSKAIANGHPVAALLGRDPLREAAERVFMGGTFWGYAPALAAALETQALLGETDTPTRLAELGRRLTRGLVERAAVHGWLLEVSGPPAMPMVRLPGDPEYRFMRRLAWELSRCGSFVHPTHNWFLSLAHREEDVEETLRHAEAALARIAARPDDPPP